MHSASAIVLDHLTVSFRGKPVLRDVSLRIGQGEVIGLIGPNGSGKTTLMKVVAGLVSPTAGEGCVMGNALGRAPYPRCGFLFEFPPFDDRATAMRNMRMLGDLSGTPGTDLVSAIERVGLDPDDRTSLGRYSQGMRKRLGFAQAIMDQPDILLLDEPMNGLDPRGMSLFHRIVKEERDRGCTVLISSHLLGELERDCDRAYLIEEGRAYSVVPDGNPGYLERSFFHCGA